MLEIIKTNLKNIPGWRTSKKIIVFESDDWGAIRTPSNVALKHFAQKSNARPDKCHYMTYDSLASEEDLFMLFELLSKHKDKYNHHPIITANCLVANPNFARIKDSNFQKYYFEDFRETLKRFPKHSKSFKLWKSGISEKIFYPQFHGREHLNISRWLTALKKGDKVTNLAFELGICSVSGHILKPKRNSHLAAFDGQETDHTFDRKAIITEGLNTFEEIFGYRSKSFIAPNYVWGYEIEEYLHKAGVQYIQGSTVQRLPSTSKIPHNIVRHYQGQKNSLGQRYLVRNCHFEPSSNPQKDWVASCLHEIGSAFFWKKPAIISTHRVNFVGYLNPQNRNRNLSKFQTLLEKMLQKWPDIEFKTSVQLGELMDKEVLLK